MGAWRWVRGSVAALLLGTSLTGCWDQHPVEFRAPVANIAVEPTQTPGQYAYTFVFPNVTITATSIESLPSSEQFYAIHVEAPTLLKAVAAVQRRQSRGLYLGQIRVLCLSSRLPLRVWKETLQETADSGRFVLTYWVVASPHARQTAEMTPPTEVVPDVALYRALNSRIQPVLWPGRSWRIWAEMATPGITPAVLDVDPSHKYVALHQLEVLSQHGPVVWDTSASNGWAYMVGRVQTGTEQVKLGSESATVGMIRGRANTRVVQTAHGVVVKLNVTCSGVVIEGMMGQGDSSAMEKKVEKDIAHRIQAHILAAWHEALKTHTDPMGFHRLGHWSDSRVGDNASDWSGWQLETRVRFSLRDEGVLR